MSTLMIATHRMVQMFAMDTVSVLMASTRIHASVSLDGKVTSTAYPALCGA